MVELAIQIHGYEHFSQKEVAHLKAASQEYTLV